MNLFALRAGLGSAPLPEQWDHPAWQDLTCPKAIHGHHLAPHFRDPIPGFLQQNMELQRRSDALLALFCLSLSSPSMAQPQLQPGALPEGTFRPNKAPSPAPQRRHLPGLCPNESKFFVQTFEARRCLLLPPPAGVNIIIQLALVGNSNRGIPFF